MERSLRLAVTERDALGYLQLLRSLFKTVSNLGTKLRLVFGELQAFVQPALATFTAMLNGPNAQDLQVCGCRVRVGVAMVQVQVASEAEPVAASTRRPYPLLAILPHQPSLLLRLPPCVLLLELCLSLPAPTLPCPCTHALPTHFTTRCPPVRCCCWSCACRCRRSSTT